jgi:hypothetical protein
VISEAEALQIAEQALERIQHVGTLHEIIRSDGSWLVVTSTAGDLQYAVRIDEATGESSVEAYKSVVIDEEL